MPDLGIGTQDLMFSSPTFDMTYTGLLLYFVKTTLSGLTKTSLHLKSLDILFPRPFQQTIGI